MTCASPARGNLRTGPNSDCRSHTEEEALAIANDTDYGLTGYVWTNDLTRAMRFTDASLKPG